MSNSWQTPSDLWRKIKPLARQMRKEPTIAENILWQRLRRKQLGVKFRRQHTIDRFIVDFYCHNAKLVIEVDGPIHDYTLDEDRLRQDYLESLGLCVIRFKNEEVIQLIDLVLDEIIKVLEDPSLTHSPLAGRNGVGLTLNFSPLDESAAREIVRWRYEPPYDIYGLENSDKTVNYLLDEQNKFHAMRDNNNELVGFCSFGEDGQVPGGDYSRNALDIGMGIRPDLTGQGRGSNFVAAVLDFAQQNFDPDSLRVTIAAFNQRAQNVWKKNGFHPIETFTFKTRNRDFVIMLKQAKQIKHSDE